MILEEDSLLDYNYDTHTHILSISWPDLSGTPLPEIENSLQKLARNIKNFDIRKMIADHRYGYTSLDNDAYKEMVENYHRQLAETNLEKLARLLPEEPAWEYFILNYSRELAEKLHLPFEIRFFSNRSEAIAWLQK